VTLWVRSGTSSADPPVMKTRFRFPPRFFVAVVLIFLLINLLFVEAYANARFAPDQDRQPMNSQRRVPADALTGGALIRADGAGHASYRLPDRTLALTFDDGPDPQWTPQVLQVLRRHQVPATFFVVGSQVARHPDLARRLVAEGNELGVHTFTHPVLGDLPAWRRRTEYAQTQMTIVHATGVHTRLLRLPYSSGPDSIDDINWPLVTEAGRLGYLSVFSDADSRDWARPGVDAIVRSSTPADGRGAVVLLHDSGGDRSQTVRALDRMIPALRQQGWQFTTVSEGYRRAVAAAAPGSASSSASSPATVVLPAPADAPAAVEGWHGTALVGAVQAADGTVAVLWALLIAVGVLTLIRTVLLCGYAIGHARRRRSPTWSWGPPVTEPVSVIVPAWNEREGIAGTVTSLVTSGHDVEVVVVDDASTDGTAAVVAALNLPGVRVVRVPWGGKAAALNAGIALSTHPIVIMVDGDTVVEPEAIHRLVQPFADPTVGAVAGNVKVGNRTTMVARWQHIEYVIGFNLDRRLYETFDCIPTVPGALGGFRRMALLAAGGVTDDTLAEDTDLTIAVHRAGWRVVYEESARAWTEAPATVRQLWLQRHRWSYGTMQALWKHRGGLRDLGRPGRFGRRGLPVLALFTVLLPLLAPLVDIFAIYGFLFLDRAQTVVTWLAVLVLQVLTGALAFRLDKEPLRALWALPLQQIVYRQLMYAVLLHSLVTAATGGRLRWQKLHRTGQAAQSAPAGHLS
jgi:cellulose synthase/poly-beta-1,6-N-acetylglucosamine synthase-like glycosyltransferase/peptidoglycan/xylan/chitin deacetylase (PgdA/CDA1 family)